MSRQPLEVISRSNANAIEQILIHDIFFITLSSNYSNLEKSPTVYEMTFFSYLISDELFI
jgi:hypothetical protein